MWGMYFNENMGVITMCKGKTNNAGQFVVIFKSTKLLHDFANKVPPLLPPLELRLDGHSLHHEVANHQETPNKLRY